MSLADASKIATAIVEGRLHIATRAQVESLALAYIAQNERIKRLEKANHRYRVEKATGWAPPDPR